MKIRRPAFRHVNTSDVLHIVLWWLPEEIIIALLMTIGIAIGTVFGASQPIWFAALISSLIVARIVIAETVNHHHNQVERRRRANVKAVAEARIAAEKAAYERFVAAALLTANQRREAQEAADDADELPAPRVAATPLFASAQTAQEA